MRFQSLLAISAAFAVASGHLLKRQIDAGLGPLLSPAASIYYPGSDGFTTSDERFTLLNHPGWQIVVHVATEADVVATVCSCLCSEIHFRFFGY